MEWHVDTPLCETDSAMVLAFLSETKGRSNEPTEGRHKPSEEPAERRRHKPSDEPIGEGVCPKR